ncbi:unnamed protein product [Pseudo-nitzschia multistriata]|uniref:Uncharacterized protein n=1 Tax=Pseudo-nitzschia multistriata TaxID=183589 RepID=A0A448Z9N4_9STRA|nr:unnamed protein product [Pseudo-nitzschia multistriata]
MNHYNSNRPVSIGFAAGRSAHTADWLATSGNVFLGVGFHEKESRRHWDEQPTKQKWHDWDTLSQTAIGGGGLDFVIARFIFVWCSIGLLFCQGDLLEFSNLSNGQVQLEGDLFLRLGNPVVQTESHLYDLRLDVFQCVPQKVVDVVEDHVLERQIVGRGGPVLHQAGFRDAVLAVVEGFGYRIAEGSRYRLGLYPHLVLSLVLQCLVQKVFDEFFSLDRLSVVENEALAYLPFVLVVVVALRFEGIGDLDRALHAERLAGAGGISHSLGSFQRKGVQGDLDLGFGKGFEGLVGTRLVLKGFERLHQSDDALLDQIVVEAAALEVRGGRCGCRRGSRLDHVQGPERLFHQVLHPPQAGAGGVVLKVGEIQVQSLRFFPLPDQLRQLGVDVALFVLQNVDEPWFCFCFRSCFCLAHGRRCCHRVQRRAGPRRCPVPRSRHKGAGTPRFEDREGDCGNNAGGVARLRCDAHGSVAMR